MPDQTTPPAPPTPPAREEEGKLPKGLFQALKESLLDLAPQVKGKDGKFVADPKFVEKVSALKASECSLASSKGNTHVVNAGAFGLRKVTV